MALDRVKLTDPVQIDAAAASIYANPASKKTLIAGVWLFNTGTTAQTVKLYLVPDSAGSPGAAAAANQIAELVLQPKESASIEIPFSFTLTDTNDTLQASATSASTVNAVVVGDQVT